MSKKRVTMTMTIMKKKWHDCGYNNSINRFMCIDFYNLLNNFELLSILLQDRRRDRQFDHKKEERMRKKEILVTVVY